MTPCPKHRRYWTIKRLTPDGWLVICPCDIVIGIVIDGTTTWARP